MLNNKKSAVGCAEGAIYILSFECLNFCEKCMKKQAFLPQKEEILKIFDHKFGCVKNCL